jgi:hypothetical protein
MRTLALVAVLGLTGCGSLFGGVSQADADANFGAWQGMTDVPLTPEQQVQVAIATERAARMVNDAAAHYAAVESMKRMVMAPAKVATGGLPWTEILTAAGAGLGSYAVYRSRKTQVEMNDPVAGAKRRAKTKAVLGAVDAAPPA